MPTDQGRALCCDLRVSRGTEHNYYCHQSFTRTSAFVCLSQSFSRNRRMTSDTSGVHEIYCYLPPSLMLLCVSSLLHSSLYLTLLFTLLRRTITSPPAHHYPLFHQRSGLTGPLIRANTSTFPWTTSLRGHSEAKGRLAFSVYPVSLAPSALCRVCN